MRTAGEQIPDLQLRGPEGSEVALSSLLERGAVALAFFKVSCPVCQYTFPFLDRVEGVVGVSQDDAGATREFAEAFDLDLPLLLDSGDEGYPVSNLFGITHVPSIFVVEQDRRISAAFSGFSRSDLEALGERFGVPMFQPGESTPAFKPG